MFETLYPLFFAAGGAVLRAVLMCLCGAVLIRKRVVSFEFLGALSRVVITLFLPCLLFSKISRNLSLDQLNDWWVLPVTATIYILIGTFLGMSFRRLFCPQANFKRAFIAASAVANSGYLPLVLVVAVCQLAPELAIDPTSADRAVACISIYLLGFTPIMWGFVYPYISGHRFDRSILFKIINPPICAILAGAICGLIPDLKNIFWGCDAPLSMISSAAETIGNATIPCAMFVLGGQLSRGPGGELAKRTIAGVSLLRLVLFPFIGLLLTWGYAELGVLPADPVVSLVLLVAASTPSAMNLAVMAGASGQEESRVATLLFWEYLFSLVTLTLFVSLYLYLLS